MSNNVSKKKPTRESEVDRENLQPRSGEQPKSQTLDLRADQPAEVEPQPDTIAEKLRYERGEDRIEVEIREIIRIKPQDFAALKNSFERWASEWQ